MLCGASPIQASSGKTVRHRLNRGGNRQANTALYRIVVVRLRWHQPTRDYLARRTTQGLSKKEAIRCLKRYVVREVFAALQLAQPRPRPLDHLQEHHGRGPQVPTVDAARIPGPVERAANGQQANRKCHHEPPRIDGAVLWSHPATQGFVVVATHWVPGWHARGQGFKSPQLHQAQRNFQTRSERHLPEICQKTRSVAARTLAVLSGAAVFFLMIRRPP